MIFKVPSNPNHYTTVEPMKNQHPEKKHKKFWFLPYEKECREKLEKNSEEVQQMWSKMCGAF